MLELLAATGFAITQPILSGFGRGADVFINLDATNPVLHPMAVHQS